MSRSLDGGAGGAAGAGGTIDEQQASAVGGRTLEVFANTPRLNAWLFSKLSEGVRGDVLEIGSGIGNLSRLILEHADRVVLSDMEPHYLETLRATFAHDPRVAVFPYDLDGPPPVEIATRRFDAIVAVNVIEHIEDDVALAGRLAALLKPGGKLLVYVPACPFVYGSLDVALGHFRRYTPASLVALMRRAGLSPEPPRYVNLLGLLGWWLNGRALRRDLLSPKQMALFERLVPLVRFEDHVRLPVGLGVYTYANKPAAM
jgi:SAM-dependent methyltransferase